MNRTTIAAAVLAAGLLFAGCSTGSDGQAVPAETVTVSASPALSKAEVTDRCADAVAGRAADTTGAEVPFEPTPEPCAPLSDSEYLDAYMDGINQANQAVLDERERAREDAAQ